MLRLAVGARREALAEAVLEPVEALGEVAHEIDLAAAEHLGDGLEAAGHLGLGLGDGRQRLVHRAGLVGRRVALAPPAQEEPEDKRQEQRNEAGGAEERAAPGHGPGAHRQRDLVHGVRPRSRPVLRTKDERFDHSGAGLYLGSAMPIRPLVILPDPRLRLVSEPVGPITDEIRRIAAAMLDTMYDAPGVGLAAIQIGEPKRMVTMDVSKGEERQPIVLINPEIVWASQERRAYEEGCLSIPDYYEEVQRPDRVRFRYRTLDGETVERDADGLLATCIQHEIDHLDGVLFIDHLSRLKRERVTKKFAKAAKREGTAPPGPPRPGA